MRESFPPVKSGDPLTQSHIRKLDRLARQVAATDYSDSHMYSTVYSGGAHIAPRPPQETDTFEVVGKQSAYIYRIKRRWYNHDTEAWQTDDGMNYHLMDAEDVGATFVSGDITAAFWDPQRNMWIPIGGGKSVDNIWCALICECALQRADLSCCVYRGSVKRYEVPEGGWDEASLCDPPATVLPAFILTDCQLNEGDDYGWVKKISSDVELTWVPTEIGEAITEKLDLYEWCCWGAGDCPSEEETITATIYHTVPAGDTDPTHQCPEGNGIEVRLSYREAQGDVINNAICDYSGWFGEFKREAEIPIRLFGMDYAPANNSGGPESEFGWVRPHWLTGEALQFFDGDVSPIDTPSSYTLTGSGDCIILTDASGSFLEETVTRYYRLGVQCTGGELLNACIQHIYPPGHPIYAALGIGILADASAASSALEFAIALEDGEFHTDLAKICTNNFVSSFDPDFGNAHTTTSAVGGSVPDGIFQGTWPSMHVFLGCFDQPQGGNCKLAISNWEVNWVDFTVNWVWK